MKWWRYCWAVASDIVFIVILSAVFNSITDGNTQKLLAASVVVYLCVIGTGVQLTRQVGAGFAGTMLVFQSVLKKTVHTDDDQDLEELDAAIVQMGDNLKERNVKILIHAVFAFIIVIWMLTILLNTSLY
jgi:hypothetical protein